MREVFKLIEQESNFRFFYNDEFNELNKKVNLDVSDKKIDDILTDILDNSEVTYRILENNVIVITPLVILLQVSILLLKELFQVLFQELTGVIQLMCPDHSPCLYFLSLG